MGNGKGNLDHRYYESLCVLQAEKKFFLKFIKELANIIFVKIKQISFPDIPLKDVSSSASA